MRYLPLLLLFATPALAESPVIAHVGQMCDAYWLNGISVHKDGTVTHDIKDVATAAAECKIVGPDHCVIVNVCESMRRIARESQEAAKKPLAPGETEL
jgi:hypothetical protein